jgi:hypothetical protein
MQRGSAEWIFKTFRYLSNPFAFEREERASQNNQKQNQPRHDPNTFCNPVVI